MSKPLNKRLRTAINKRGGRYRKICYANILVEQQTEQSESPNSSVSSESPSEQSESPSSSISAENPIEQSKSPNSSVSSESPTEQSESPNSTVIVRKPKQYRTFRNTRILNRSTIRNTEPTKDHAIGNTVNETVGSDRNTTHSDTAGKTLTNSWQKGYHRNR